MQYDGFLIFTLAGPTMLYLPDLYKASPGTEASGQRHSGDESNTLYETAPKWNDFLMIGLPLSIYWIKQLCSLVSFSICLDDRGAYIKFNSKNQLCHQDTNTLTNELYYKSIFHCKPLKNKNSE